MPPDQPNLLQGALDMMILKALALDELHGLGASRRIEQITKGTFQVNPARSSRLCIGWKNKAGWAPLGRESENKRRAKYYKLNQCGTAPTGSEDQPLGPHCAGDNPDTGSLLKETL